MSNHPKHKLQNIYFRVGRAYSAFGVLPLLAFVFYFLACKAEFKCSACVIQSSSIKTFQVLDFNSAEMIRVANKIVQQGYSATQIAGILKFLLSEEQMDRDQLVYLLPLLFPEELQDASKVPPNCAFAKEKNGRFTWLFPFRRIVLYRDFPVECVGSVGNDGIVANDRELFTWLSVFGKCRETLLEPPNDLIDWLDQFSRSAEFKELSANLNLSEERVRSVIRYRVIQVLNCLPGSKTALDKTREWRLLESDWNQFLKTSEQTRPMVIWEGTKFEYDR